MARTEPLASDAPNRSNAILAVLTSSTTTDARTDPSAASTAVSQPGSTSINSPRTPTTPSISCTCSNPELSRAAAIASSRASTLADHVCSSFIADCCSSTTAAKTAAAESASFWLWSTSWTMAASTFEAEAKLSCNSSRCCSASEMSAANCSTRLARRSCSAVSRSSPRVSGPNSPLTSAALLAASSPTSGASISNESASPANCVSVSESSTSCPLMLFSRLVISASSSNNRDDSASRVRATSAATSDPRSCSVVRERSSTRAIKPRHLSLRDSTLGSRSIPWSPAAASCASEAVISISSPASSPRNLTCSALVSRVCSFAAAWAVSRVRISLPVR